MESKILADTSVLVNLQKGNEDTLKTFDRIKEVLYISRVTACEFIYGSRNKKEKDINKDFIEHFSILEINSEISKYAYFLLIKYGLNTKFNIADSFIAASAIIESVKFWTLNTKHFKTIKELKLFKI